MTTKDCVHSPGSKGRRVERGKNGSLPDSTQWEQHPGFTPKPPSPIHTIAPLHWNLIKGSDVVVSRTGEAEPSNFLLEYLENVRENRAILAVLWSLGRYSYHRDNHIHVWLAIRVENLGGNWARAQNLLTELPRGDCEIDIRLENDALLSPVKFHM